MMCGMTAQSAPSTPRAAASRVAKWFISKGRTDDAVQVLTAWAVTGPNDQEGQTLLAEALRIDPSAVIAKAAFERMEGIVGEHAELEAAIAKYTREEIAKLEAEIKRPSFRRAQVGFNNNMKFRDQVFHVQTEDSGLDKPHIITHLFADGGRVIKSHKRTYASEVSRDDVSAFVRALMKAQHMEMVLMLREGKFDEILAGKKIGGLETLTEPPNADVRKVGKGKRETEELAGPAEQIRRAQFKVAEASAPAEPAPEPKLPTPAPIPAPVVAKTVPSKPAPAKGPVRFKLHTGRAVWDAPAVFAPEGDEVAIGRVNAGVLLEGERFCHPREALLQWRDGKLFIEDVEGGCGVFLRIKTPVELEIGDEFIIGDQLARILENPVPDVGPGPGPTYFYSAPTWLSSFRVVQIYEGDREGACVVARGTTVVCGRSVADLVFDDPLVDEQHCIVEEQAGTIVLTDLGSRTGVFARVKGEHELAHGDEILVGRTRLKVDLRVPAA
jgi:pSer/pThr/pTyr-binding forkhead associated (FHA) protein